MKHTHVHELTNEELFCLEGCRSYKQYYKMRKGFEGDACAFCNLDRNFNNVLFEDEHVFAWAVPEEYLRASLAIHTVVVPKRHLRFETDMTDAEGTSVLHAKREMRKQFPYDGGMPHVREGDMRLNAGTVPHLHYNNFVPNRTTEVRVPIFKDPKTRDKNILRAEGFHTQYISGEMPE